MTRRSNVRLTPRDRDSAACARLNRTDQTAAAFSILFTDHLHRVQGTQCQKTFVWAETVRSIWVDDQIIIEMK